MGGREAWVEQKREKNKRNGVQMAKAASEEYGPPPMERDKEIKETQDGLRAETPNTGMVVRPGGGSLRNQVLIRSRRGSEHLEFEKGLELKN